MISSAWPLLSSGFLCKTKAPFVSFFAAVEVRTLRAILSSCLVASFFLLVVLLAAVSVRDALPSTKSAVMTLGRCIRYTCTDGPASWMIMVFTGLPPLGLLAAAIFPEEADEFISATADFFQKHKASHLLHLARQFIAFMAEKPPRSLQGHVIIVGMSLIAVASGFMVIASILSTFKACILQATQLATLVYRALLWASLRLSVTLIRSAVSMVTSTAGITGCYMKGAARNSLAMVKAGIAMVRQGTHVFLFKLKAEVGRATQVFLLRAKAGMTKASEWTITCMSGFFLQLPAEGLRYVMRQFTQDTARLPTISDGPSLAAVRTPAHSIKNAPAAANGNSPAAGNGRNASAARHATFSGAAASSPVPAIFANAAPPPTRAAAATPTAALASAAPVPAAPVQMPAANTGNAATRQASVPGPSAPAATGVGNARPANAPACQVVTIPLGYASKQPAAPTSGAAMPAGNARKAQAASAAAPGIPMGGAKQANAPASGAAAPAYRAAAPAHDKRRVSAAPTERPSSAASRPPTWWGDDTDRPHMWTPMDDPLTFQCVPLDEDSTEHQLWSGRMETFGLKVTAVTRIQNPRLWERYVLERRHMLQGKVVREGHEAPPDLPPFDLHESLLYHCSSEPDHTRICEEGLDLRLAKEGTFGAGIYLTDDPRKAISYSNNTGKLYVCAALLGDVLAVPARDEFAPWKREPEKAVEDRRSHADKHFDSVVGRRAGPSGNTGANEFVLYKQSATCPIYMVEFAGASKTLKSRGTPHALSGVPNFAWRSMGAHGAANVQNPFGFVAGTTNYIDDGSRWDLFLYTFYHAVAPEAENANAWMCPIGEDINADDVDKGSLIKSACIGRVLTETVLARLQGIKCIICQSALIKGDTCLVMPCGHVNGHADCCLARIKTRIMADGVTSQTFTRCEQCMKRFGVTVGTQPLSAKMTHRVDPYITLAEHGKGAIKIAYIIPNGRQEPDGDDPGKPFKGTFREAYLPDSTEGYEVLKWLQQAFKQRLIFSIGTSLTTGRDNVVIWAGIHHKTDLTPNAEHGYPDGAYLKRVKEEMQQAGVVL
eukprot:jgi/Mesvir1/15809/Mv03365-RA.2